MRNLSLTILAVLSLMLPAAPAVADGPRYASGFTFDQKDGFTLVTVTTPWQGATADDARQYLLYRRGTEPPAGYQDALAVAVPVRSVITMSTTILPHLEQLGETSALVAVDSLAWVYSPVIRSRGEQGAIVDVGSGTMVDVERTLSLDPDVIFANSYGGEWDAHPTLERVGLPIAISGDWVEQNPLGRAEWILFTALFFDKLDVAQQLFREIESSYLGLSTLAAGAVSRPTVLINAPYQGTWSIAGGESYAARFIQDAGGRYIWEDDQTAGALFLDFETVLAEAGSADVWINPGVWGSLADGRSEDRRFERFESFSSGMVFNNNRRVSPGGGIDYFESGAANPHIVLKDLIWAFHPELVPGYEPYYYHQLK